MKDQSKTKRSAEPADEVSVLRQKLSDMDRKLLLAQEESLRKSVFLSHMSHEIRTPVSGIIGLAELAKGLTEEGTQLDFYMNQIHGLSEHLLSLIHHILDFSRMEAGKVILEEKEFDLYDLAEKLHSMFCESVRSKGLKFTVELLDFDTTRVMGDELRLSQVLVNFLSNAKKFTQKGEIRLTMRQLHREDDRIDLMIAVHDTGIGMEADFMNRIFQPFEQENSDIGRVFGGSGLGMAIADQIIRLMGGEIAVSSMPQKGSDFMVFLNLETVPEMKAAQMAEEDGFVEKRTNENRFEGQRRQQIPLNGLRILLAEDNEINAMVAQKLLEQQGAEVERVPDGKQALETFLASPAEYYDLILMDVQMPVMDGRTATRCIRAADREDAGKVLIFALSADAFAEDRQKSFDCGMDAHLVKPLDFSGLGSEIVKAKNRSRDFIHKI